MSFFSPSLQSICLESTEGKVIQSKSPGHVLLRPTRKVYSPGYRLPFIFPSSDKRLKRIKKRERKISESFLASGHISCCFQKMQIGFFFFFTGGREKTLSPLRCHSPRPASRKRCIIIVCSLRVNTHSRNTSRSLAVFTRPRKPSCKEETCTPLTPLSGVIEKKNNSNSFL